MAAASLHDDLRVCIFEKNRIPGRKIMATGGGRCNMTNRTCVNRDATLDFFASLGLETRCDDEGRYYPYTDRAADVVRVLVDAQSENVKTFFACSVQKIVKAEDGFQVFASAGGEGASGSGEAGAMADCVILAAGGKAAPQYGTTGDGYRIARALGHSVRKVFPILAPVECTDEDGEDMRGAKGIRARGRAVLLRDGRPVPGAPAETGEIQFTEDGLSGICIFNLTPYIRAEEGELLSDAMKRFSLSLDFAPDIGADRLKARAGTFGVLTEELARIADRKMHRAGRGPESIKDWKFRVTNVKGWRNAQCTAGGVSTDEIDMDTMESKLVPGLYFAGEIIDIQGPCGGFNLQNSWETGAKVARAINGKAK